MWGRYSGILAVSGGFKPPYKTVHMACCSCPNAKFISVSADHLEVAAQNIRALSGIC